MSQKQKSHPDQMLRNAPLDLGGDVAEQRRIFDQMLSSQPLPADVRTADITLGGVPTITVDVNGASSDPVLLYFHGGACVIGSAATSLPFAADVARRAGSWVITVDDRLVPEHPHPAALDAAVAAYRGLLEIVDPSHIAIVGEPSGGGLSLAAGGAVFSPWADLVVPGGTIDTKAAVDPLPSGTALRTRVRDYVASADSKSTTVSPVFADFSGLPTLLVKVGSHEILLDDVFRVVARAAAADADVRLHVVAGAPHVFQSFAPLVDEAAAALDEAATFFRETFAAAAPVATHAAAGALGASDAAAPGDGVPASARSAEPVTTDEPARA